MLNNILSKVKIMCLLVWIINCQNYEIKVLIFWLLLLYKNINQWVSFKRLQVWLATIISN